MNKSPDHLNSALLNEITLAFKTAGIRVEDLKLEDLGRIDEFHIGGRHVTHLITQQLNLRAGQQLLDIGCGIGGTARYLVDTYNCQVRGIDSNPEYIATGRTLNHWVNVADKIDLNCCNALDMPYDSNYFDCACMLHVGMNIDDKSTLFSEIYRVINTQGKLLIYDVMSTDSAQPEYPLPWADDASESHLETLNDYLKRLTAAGFKIDRAQDHRDTALKSINALRDLQRSGNKPDMPGLEILMGQTFSQKISNLTAGLTGGLIAPFEIIASK
jgi:ubiquinone/menaquinone biosynthesis C-methylase UbiE